jgi:hypothetical protein
VRYFPWRQVSRLTLTGLLFAAVLASAPRADAGALPSALTAPAGACSAKLYGYHPQALSVYGAEAGVDFLYLEGVREAADAEVSGTYLYLATEPDNHFYSGDFKGRITGQSINVTGDKNTENWSFSFKGTVSCLLSQITAGDVTTDPAGRLPRSLKLTSICTLSPAWGIGIPESTTPACLARQILDGVPQRGWKDIPGKGSIPYAWYGGHPSKEKIKGVYYGPGNGNAPGPSLGSCYGYIGPHADKKDPKPCLDYKYSPVKTVGLDCSGFTRWVLYLLMYRDVLGPGNAADQYKELIDAAPAPGDLVFFKGKTGWDHVGILIAPGVMIDEPHTREIGEAAAHAALRVDKVTSWGKAYYKAYTFPIVG